MVEVAVGRRKILLALCVYIYFVVTIYSQFYRFCIIICNVGIFIKADR